MSKTTLRKPLDALPSWSDAGECPGCGKKMYRVKKDARNALKAKHPDDRMNVYRCVSDNEMVPEPRPWHIGHLATAVRNGETTRGEWYSDDEVDFEVDCSYIDNREKGTGMACSLLSEHNGPHLAMNSLGDWVNIDPSERCSD